MRYGDTNPKHQSPFTFKDYTDRGWANSGILHCKCSREHGAKEEYDNGLYVCRGTDIITICHTCKTFIHTDMSD
jgi:hypothetical protein